MNEMVLIVDNGELICSANQEVLFDEGCQVRSAADGLTFLKRLKLAVKAGNVAVIMLGFAGFRYIVTFNAGVAMVVPASVTGKL